MALRENPHGKPSFERKNVLEMLTVFTPTYNRAQTLPRLYRSLLQQTCMDFEWLVVDDGSLDETASLLAEWVKESKFTVRYIQKENGGKYRAYNVGLREAKGELFFCVDSDDWLPPHSVERIMEQKELLDVTSNIAGFIALKDYANGEIIGNPFHCKETKTTLFHLEEIGEGGERSLVFKTSIARQYPFPEETHEKFLTESVIYDRYHPYYQFHIINQPLCTCEYQTDGLSSNPQRLMVQNPSGYKLYFSQRIDLESGLFARLKNAIKYHAFRVLSHSSVFPYKGKHQCLVRLTYPLGNVFAIIYKLKTR